jgi:hypothetical protein
MTNTMKPFSKQRRRNLIKKIIINLRKILEAIPGKYSIDSLQQTAVLGTPHVIRKVLQCEAGPSGRAV